MTDDEIAAAVLDARAIEHLAKAEWDRLAAAAAGVEQQIAMTATRQAGSLRRALEQWIVARATDRAAATR